LKDYIQERVVATAKYIMDTRATVRDTAKVFGVSKSTVHKDVTERLPRVNPSLAEKVKEVLEYNKAERHIRGGKATKEKYRMSVCAK
jgi:putative DeoR family transcriptional regulator (stage III sporulation protein D)